ncbi:MAG: peptidylprolyl isomerase [Proteobacteria bacterium]|nr:peptidylprolyl isomerase [Pseudomonadota bacterium]
MFSLKYPLSKIIHLIAFTVISFSTLVLLPLQRAQAQTVVRVNTSLGEFSIELFDEITPVTVNNFLNYVTSGRYNGTVVHRSVAGFIVQGGWLTFDEASSTFSPIDTDPTIVNEFKVSNTRGTIAMAKLGGDPDSASNQWFINLADNSSNLDFQNGGFTAFGVVLGNGMEVVDAINALSLTNVVAGYAPFPLIDFDGITLTNANLVNIEMSVVDDLADAPNVFDEATGLLNLRVDAGASGVIALSFSIFSTEPAVVIQAIADSVESIGSAAEGYATFDAASGSLSLPELVINGVVAYRNLVFVLIDADQLLFELNSFEE